MKLTTEQQNEIAATIDGDGMTPAAAAPEVGRRQRGRLEGLAAGLIGGPEWPDDAAAAWGLLLDGAWAPAREGGTARATSPSSGADLAEVAVAGPANVDAAVAAGRRYRGRVGRVRISHSARAAALRRMADAVVAHAEVLTQALSADQGKPLAEARDETAELEVYLRMAAEDAVRLEGRLPPSIDPGRRILLQRVPLGVVAVIVPWNWPYTMAAELFAPRWPRATASCGSPRRQRVPARRSSPPCSLRRRSVCRPGCSDS